MNIVQIFHGEIKKISSYLEHIPVKHYALFALKRKFLQILEGNLANQACQEAGEEL